MAVVVQHESDVPPEILEGLSEEGRKVVKRLYSKLSLVLAWRDQWWGFIIFTPLVFVALLAIAQFKWRQYFLQYGLWDMFWMLLGVIALGIILGWLLGSLIGGKHARETYDELVKSARDCTDVESLARIRDNIRDPNTKKRYGGLAHEVIDRANED